MGLQLLDEVLEAGQPDGHDALVDGAPVETISQFFATGMLLNVLAMMGELTEPDAWAERLVDGCTKE